MSRRSTVPRFENISLASARALVGADGADFAIYLPPSGSTGPVLYRDEAAGLLMPDFERMREQGVREFLVAVEDFSRCEALIEEKLGEVLCSPETPAREKAEVASNVGERISRDILASPMDEVQFGRASSFVNHVLSGLLTDATISSYILQMAEHERTVAAHMMIVSVLAVTLGMEVLGEDRQTLHDLGMAGMLHDLGKLAISAKILNKTNPLTREEAQMIQQHPIETVRLIDRDPHVSMAARQMIIQHHERVDGKGYPVRMSGAALLVGSRLLAIVDSFHAMVGTRFYRLAKSPAEATRAIERQAGRQFDAEFVAAWIELFSRQRAERLAEIHRAPDDVFEANLPAHPDHKNLHKTIAYVGPRPSRFPCGGKTVVRCVYAGRLHATTQALDEFAAPLHDLSRGGLCVYTPHPLFRGEVLNVHLHAGRDPFWVRGTVVWCSQQSAHIFKSGVRFVERIEESQVHECVPVKGLEEMAVMETAITRPDGGNAKPPPQPVTEKDRALESLRGLSENDAPPHDGVNAALTLAMSGDADIRRQSIDVLGRMKGPAAARMLIHMLADPEPAVRCRAAEAVGEIRLASAADALRALQHDVDKDVAASAAVALRQLRARDPASSCQV